MGTKSSRARLRRTGHLRRSLRRRRRGADLGPAELERSSRRVPIALALWALGLFGALSLSTDLFGPVGAALAAVLGGALGFVAWAVVVHFGYAGLAVVRGQPFTARRVLTDLAVGLVIAMQFELMFGLGGGFIGEALARSAEAAFTNTGAVLVGLVALTSVSIVRLDLVRAASPVVARIRATKRKSERSFLSPQRAMDDAHDASRAADATSIASGDAAHTAREVEVRDCAPSLSLEVSGRRSNRQSFSLPSVELLARGVLAQSCDESTTLVGASLVDVLRSFGVEGELEDVTVGPVVSTFELTMTRGTKIAKVVSLEPDLGLAIGRKVRVVPGKLGRVAVEIPNEHRNPVALRELIADPSFSASKAALAIVLGRDVRGLPVVADLAEQPHMLIAGATGAGKSVALNAIICSLLMRLRPDQLRLVLIDPKQVELASYAEIPHLAVPIITDPEQAVESLHRVVAEMERRFELLGRATAKNVGAFNALGLAVRLPYLVVVIDELADLIASGGKCVESLVVRIVAKGRAAGIHVVIATQRPSVDVISGLLKANVPSRVAFRTASSVDSRVVLDEEGAEQLLGKGDSLVRLNGADAALRVQCPYVDDIEIDAVTAYLRAQVPARCGSG